MSHYLGTPEQDRGGTWGGKKKNDGRGPPANSAKSASGSLRSELSEDNGRASYLRRW